MQKSNRASKAILDEYSELIKTVARVEYSRLSQSSHLLEFSELLNIGATAVYVIVSSQPKNYHNKAYISTAIKWAIRNELRRRYRWYSLKSSSKKEDEDVFAGQKELRCSVYETILSIDDMQQAENPVQIEDPSMTPDKKAELFELKSAIQKDLCLNQNFSKIKKLKK